jgi:hypothetical protein
LSLCPHLLLGQGIPYHKGTWKEAFLSGIKWLEREANHSSPSSDEVKTIWSYYFRPVFHNLHFHGVAFN